MAIELSDAARAYLADRTMRAGIVDLLEHDEDKSELRLPWEEARDFARARLMAEVAKADLIDLLFALWDEVWGRHIPRLGPELPVEDDMQAYFMPAGVWYGRGIDRCFEMPKGTSFRKARYIYPGIYFWHERSPEVSVRVWFCDGDGESIKARIPEGWRRQPAEGGDGWAEGAVAVEPIDGTEFVADPASCLIGMQAAADRMISEVIG